MAAVSNVTIPEIIDLRQLREKDLDPLLDEEGLTWRSLFNWDSGASSDLVRRFVKIQALNGFALVQGGRVIGYSYYVCEDRKSLIGDLYLLREFATVENEDLLLGAVLQALFNTPYMLRVEAQLLMMHGPFERPMPFSRYLKVHPRNFMMTDLADSADLPGGRAMETHLFEPWTDRRQDEAAKLIAQAYEGHVDGTINDQYRSVSGAKRFLLNIVQYPGCGSFFGPASYVALNASGELVGISLASLVSEDSGHITQICVSPEERKTGTGYEMLRRSLLSLAEHGCRKTSLTVTASNQDAIRLYQRMGFRAMRRFAAYVWEGF
ncbi:MAG: GNAT family N-acetyltransferase [Bryobacteraceae bacterium]